MSADPRSENSVFVCMVELTNSIIVFGCSCIFDSVLAIFDIVRIFELTPKVPRDVLVWCKLLSRLDGLLHDKHLLDVMT